MKNCTHFIVMRYRTFVLSQVTFCSKGHSATFALKRTFEVVNIDM